MPADEMTPDERDEAIAELLAEGMRLLLAEEAAATRVLADLLTGRAALKALPPPRRRRPGG